MIARPVLVLGAALLLAIAAQAAPADKSTIGGAIGGGGKADSAKPDLGKPDLGKPDLGKPDLGKPDLGKPDVGKPEVEKTEPGSATADAAGLEATTAKFNAYITYMNRTLRAVDALARYRSWVNMKTGPTGRERLIYGLYAPYDVKDERAEAEKALGATPSLPALDDAMRAYIATNDTLSPVLIKADGYYSRADYKLDAMAEGKALHPQIVADGDAFLAARSRLETVMRTQKLALDQIRLATIEKKVGRKTQWHVTNVMMHGKQALDTLESDGAAVDMAAFDTTMSQFGEAVKGMDEYSAAHPGAFSAFSSFPDSLLSHMREVQGRLKRTKGNLRRAAGLDMTFIQSDWNTMVQTSDMVGMSDDK